MDKRILLPLVILPAFQTGNMHSGRFRPSGILLYPDQGACGNGREGNQEREGERPVDRILPQIGRAHV